MDEKTSRNSDTGSAAPAGRRVYTKPKLVEYGNIAKLTNNKGNTLVEAGHPNMAPNCL